MSWYIVLLMKIKDLVKVAILSPAGINPDKGHE